MTFSIGSRIGENGTVGELGEIGGLIGGVITVGLGTVGGGVNTGGVVSGGAWGIRCSSLGVSSTTFTVPGSAFLPSRSGGVNRDRLAPSMACKAIEPRIAIEVGSTRISKKFLRWED